jgi:hypothetical protein
MLHARQVAPRFERAAVPAPGEADVCHLPIVVKGSHPDNTHLRFVSSRRPAADTVWKQTWTDPMRVTLKRRTRSSSGAF